MTRRIAILRPEPGNAATARTVREAGLDPLSLPLFKVRPLAWNAPDPETFDGLLLTSANALRHGGPSLAAFTALPVLAVGGATAAAARAAGFHVTATGTRDVADLLAGTAFQRLLWLSGRERTALDHSALGQAIAVYAADARPLSATEATAVSGTVALLHSSRAAEHLARELDRHDIARSALRIAAISAKVARSAGPGWDAAVIATLPNDDALIAAARSVAIDP